MLQALLEVYRIDMKYIRTMFPLIGLMYKTFGKYRKENMECLEKTEQEVISWIEFEG